ncbi:MAG: hypothetical protein QOE44_1435 [Solirubrobacteraceae bacterium]|nr:hypothetical protein [Solirubrobacteraceae bacterium]
MYVGRARLPPGPGFGSRVPEAVADAGLESVRRRWNQFGIEAKVAVGAEPESTVIHYRLSISGHPDAEAVHAAFRDDLRQAAGAILTRAAPPPSWSLEDLGCVDSPPPPELTYESDTGFDWSDRPADG